MRPFGIELVNEGIERSCCGKLFGFLRDTDDTKRPRRDIARKHELRTFISLVNGVPAR